MKHIAAFTLVAVLAIFSGACTQNTGTDGTERAQESIEVTLNLANNAEQEWSYSEDTDAWVLSVVPAVAYPELPDQQGVSVCVPGGYVTGIDTNDDGNADVTAGTYAEPANGSLVIDYETRITSTNGQVYTAATAPVIINTGAAGYGSQNNSLASTNHAKDGYINVSCGNRGKQDIAEDESGESYYTGDAPSCLVDQKAAARYVKYNMLLGNLPGNVDYFVSTGGSGGGAHAVMFAATSNNADFYDYQIAAGAVGVYRDANGDYSTTITIDGTEHDISDGAWGCVAYSAITSLYEADMSQAFEYFLNTGYGFNTSFQEQLAEYLSDEYMEYINEQNLSVKESEVGFDLNGDGSMKDTITLALECDVEAYPETNGYHGTYLDLYLAEFTGNLQWYLDNLDYAEGWTWFGKNGDALSDEDVAVMTSEDKARAFIEGRYAKGTSDGAMPGGGMSGMPSGGAPDGGMPGGDAPDGGMPGGGAPDDGMFSGGAPDGGMPGGDAPAEGDLGQGQREVGTPDGGTTQSASSSTDSSDYGTYDDMLDAYQSDIEEIYAGDMYGKNIVSLYNPIEYIGKEGTEDPVWSKIVMGATEGDISLFASLNLRIAWINAGVDSEIEWQWDGGHVPSEVLGDSFSLHIDQMYGEYVDGSVEIAKASAPIQTKNGTATEPTGKDISDWVNADDIKEVSFSLAAALSYRTARASKAVPGFDVIDYGQEDFVFGDKDKDARHWDKYLLAIFQEHADVLEPLFNGS